MKRIFCCLLAALCLTSLLAGCSQNPVRGPKNTGEKKTAAQLLGATDDELVAQRGEGEVQDYAYQGSRLIQQRKYQEELFGLSAQVEYLYSDDQHIQQIVGTFPDTDKEAVVEAITQFLGEPKELQTESEELDFMARWEQDGIVYIVRRIPDSVAYVLMEKLNV